MSERPIKAHIVETAWRNRTRRELLFALVLFLLLIILGWIQLQFLGVHSYLFLAVFNLNLILLLLVLFLVVRNGVKLFLDRRRNVKGSRLRAKLVKAFILLSIMPTILMFIVAVNFVQTSVDYWFRTQVDDSMDMALEVGKDVYSQIQNRLDRQGGFIIEQIRERGYLWGAQGMDNYLQQKAQEYDLSLIGVLTPDLRQQNWHAEPQWQNAWPRMQRRANWQELNENPQSWSSMLQGQTRDHIVKVLPVDEAQTGFLVLGRSFEEGILSKLDSIVEGVSEYQQLQSLRNPLKNTFYMVLAAMTLLIVFGAMWFGFRLAKEISAPIQALSLGTQRISHGDLGVRLEDPSSDELGMLVQSFNNMAGELEESQKSLSRANEDLARQNRELEQRRSYMEAVLNNITSGVVSLDTEDRILSLNRAAEAILDIEEESLRGLNPREIELWQYREFFRRVLSRFRDSSQRQWQNQMDVSLPHGERKLLVSLVDMSSNQGEITGSILVFEDVTELDRMQRMAAWREVARRIAHEIKNPLTPIKLSAQRLDRKFGPRVEDSSFSESISLIVRQVEHMQQMVQEFSAFAKLPELALEYNELLPVLQEAVELFKHSHPHIQWSLHADNSLPGFRFDRSALKQVLINLLSNACEVLKEEFEPRVEISAGYDSERSSVWIAVEDNGPGLDPEERDRLFEPYFSRKRAHAGLGLSIVQSIVEDHQGTIKAERSSEGGMVFKMEIPDG